MIHRQKNIYIYKYLFWAKYPPFYAPDQEKKNLKFCYAPYGLKEYRCKASTIYLYYYKSYYKLQETSEVLWKMRECKICIWPGYYMVWDSISNVQRIPDLGEEVSAQLFPALYYLL